MYRDLAVFFSDSTRDLQVGESHYNVGATIEIRAAYTGGIEHWEKIYHAPREGCPKSAGLDNASRCQQEESIHAETRPYYLGEGPDGRSSGAQEGPPSPADRRNRAASLSTARLRKHAY